MVLDTKLRTPLDSQLVRTAAEDVLLVCGQDAEAAREEALRSREVHVERLPVFEGRVDATAVLDLLFVRGVRSVLVEAGSTLNGELLRRDLVDKAVLYYASSELGLDALPFAQGAGSPYALQERLSGVERVVFAHGADEDVRVSGYLHDPWASVL